MGYRTDFSLSVDIDWTERDELVSALDEVTGYNWDTDLELYDRKWYEHDEHMRKVSAMFPDTFFELEGKGEEQGDHWIEYYKGGKMQRANAVITFEDYDEGKLK